MPVPTEKIALFIDGANLYATAKTLGFDIDYKKLLDEFRRRGVLVRAYYYTAVFDDQEYSPLRPLIDWLDYNGFTVETKAAKRYVEQSTGVTRTPLRWIASTSERKSPSPENSTM